MILKVVNMGLRSKRNTAYLRFRILVLKNNRTNVLFDSQKKTITKQVLQEL